MLSRKISGAKLRRLREDRCLSVAAVAEAAGCTRWNIYKIEKGESQPSPKVYRAIKDVLQAQDEDLEDLAGSAA